MTKASRKFAIVSTTDGSKATARGTSHLSIVGGNPSLLRAPLMFSGGANKTSDVPPAVKDAPLAGNDAFWAVRHRP